MIVYPAIDLRGGRVVQLVGGRPEHERISLPDPVAVAQRFVAHGFRALHVVDLDAALQDGCNRTAVHSIISAVDIPVLFGGGVRDDQAVRDWLAAGAARVIAGTRAIEDRAWLEVAAQRFPGRVVVAADVLGDTIVTHGWRRSSGVPLAGFLDRVDALPLAGLLVTDVGREGRLAGVDAGLFGALQAATRIPIIAAGGIRSLQDLRDLDAAGIAGAVVGTALYTGAIDPGAATEEFTDEQVP
ncbi:MAG: 1-(5-phosphoribosyl)-5-[(5-phosphoribosylamino)methylideneamino] imidazole-4-carboxamide isomerase [Acidobacteriota bacterium]|jgi:phosphoribosylformimino-5-aminoimidazole carboxamide ribotide isomerase